MLFMAVYRLRNPSEESHKRALQLFTNWTPPFEIKAHYSRADGNGGVVLFDAADATVLLEVSMSGCRFSRLTSAR